MHPEAFTIAGMTLRSYALAALIGALCGLWLRRVEVARLGYGASAGHRWVGLGALVGAVVGAKLGMVLFEPAAPLGELFGRMLTLDFAGKTVVGGVAGGYLGVELAKRLAGVRHSTGDAFAVALPASLAFGRLGCLLEGCCYGAPTALPWAIDGAGVARHPVQLVEAAGLAAIALWRWRARRRPLPAGNHFKRTLVMMAALRAATQALRGDPVAQLGPLDAVQWVCLAAIVGFGAAIWRSERGPNRATPTADAGGAAAAGAGAAAGA